MSQNLSLYLVFWGNVKSFPREASSLYFPISHVGETCLCTSLPAVAIRSLQRWPSSVCVLESHCFLSDGWWQTSFYVSTPYACFSPIVLSFIVHCPFVFFFLLLSFLNILCESCQRYALQIHFLQFVFLLCWDGIFLGHLSWLCACYPESINVVLPGCLFMIFIVWSAEKN